MFKLVVFLFAAANPEPIGGMTYNKATFDTHQACVEFVESEEGMLAIAPLEKAARDKSITIKAACVKSEDRSI